MYFYLQWYFCFASEEFTSICSSIWSSFFENHVEWAAVFGRWGLWTECDNVVTPSGSCNAVRSFLSADLTMDTQSTTTRATPMKATRSDRGEDRGKVCPLSPPSHKFLFGAVHLFVPPRLTQRIGVPAIKRSKQLAFYSFLHEEPCISLKFVLTLVFVAV